MGERLDQIRLISSWIFLFGNTYWLILWCVVLRYTRLRFLWVLVATGTLGVILAVIGLIFIVHLRRMEDSFGFDTFWTVYAVVLAIRPVLFSVELVVLTIFLRWVLRPGRSSELPAQV